MKKSLLFLVLFFSFIVNLNANTDIINLKIEKSNNNSLLLNWDANEEVNYYKIYRSTNKKGKYKEVKSLTENTFINTGLTYGKTYHYKVVSYDENSKSISKIVSKKVTPNGVIAKISSVGQNNIKIFWEKESVKGYEIYRSLNKKTWKKIKIITKNSTLSFNNTKLTTNKTYYYKVRSYVIVNGKKIYSNFSNVVSAKTLTKRQKEIIDKVKKLNTYKYSKERISSKIASDSKTKEFAFNYLKINFNENAFYNVNKYMELFSFSKEELSKQLKEYDKFTDEEINYAINNYIGEYGNELFKEEYYYKKNLYLLGYNGDEVNEIYNLFSADEIDNFLLDKKYNNLLDFKKSPYFVVNNINRYQNYYDKNSYNYEDVVLYVEIGIDYDFYTHMKKANVSDGKLMLINKYSYHDKNYNANLVKLGSGYGNGSLNKEAATYFRQMVDAAKKDGIKLRSISAYRSYTTQRNIYNRYVSKDGVKKADTYSARPGHSEHSTGLAVDINTASSKTHFENTKEYAWLINNSYKYGFVERYKKGKQFITGYKYEPWHFRYFGVEVATELHDMNVTYEEYLVMKR